MVANCPDAASENSSWYTTTNAILHHSMPHTHGHVSSTLHRLKSGRATGVLHTEQRSQAECGKPYVRGLLPYQLTTNTTANTMRSLMTAKMVRSNWPRTGCRATA